MLLQAFGFPLHRDDGPRGLVPDKIKLKIMEQLNKIEIRGYVGNITRYEGERAMARMTVATSHAFKDRTGAAVIETTWHNVIAWEGKGVQDLEKLEKGSKVYVCGRLRNQKYTGADGVDRMSYDITASKLNLIDGDEPFSYEI